MNTKQAIKTIRKLALQIDKLQQKIDQTQSTINNIKEKKGFI